MILTRLFPGEKGCRRGVSETDVVTYTPRSPVTSFSSPIRVSGEVRTGDVRILPRPLGPRSQIRVEDEPRRLTPPLTKLERPRVKGGDLVGTVERVGTTMGEPTSGGFKGVIGGDLDVTVKSWETSGMEPTLG